MHEDDQPAVISNAEFAGYEEEDIQRLNEAEGKKFGRNPQLSRVKTAVAKEFGPGHWEEHWVTLDDDGRRVYALVYLSNGGTAAVTADGGIVRAFKI